jgi:NADP-dependent 3-hydroxy acid dehydrogenase YdfG
MAPDPVLLITGASTGIGAATARLAAQQGYRLVLGARSEDKLAALAEELGGPERAIAVRCDVTEAADQDAAVQRALDSYGRLDALLANAGVSLGDRGFADGNPDEWRTMILTNVLGAALSIRAGAAALKATRGHLLLTSSMAGRRAIKGSLYSATKFAVTAMGEAARQDFNGTGVRVTVLSPGRVETEGFHHDMDDALEAEDIARAILFAMTQPPHVDVNEIAIRPTAQDS